MGAQVRRWSTDSVDESQRLAYWMDSICDSFLEMKAKPNARDGFFGSIRQSKLSAVWVYETQGSAQDVSRDQGAIARGRADNHFYLISQMGSPWSIRHAGREETLSFDTEAFEAPCHVERRRLTVLFGVVISEHDNLLDPFRWRPRLEPACVHCGPNGNPVEDHCRKRGLDAFGNSHSLGGLRQPNGNAVR